MTEKLYLVSRPAAGTDYGHLFLLRWDDVTKSGRTIGGQGISNLTGQIDLESGDDHAYTARE